MCRGWTNTKVWFVTMVFCRLLARCAILDHNLKTHTVHENIYVSHTVPFLVYRSTYTVGLPWESKISQAWIFKMDMVLDLQMKWQEKDISLVRFHRLTDAGCAALSLTDLKLRVKTVSWKKPECSMTHVAQNVIQFIAWVWRAINHLVDSLIKYIY